MNNLNMIRKRSRIAEDGMDEIDHGSLKTAWTKSITDRFLLGSHPQLIFESNQRRLQPRRLMRGNIQKVMHACPSFEAKMQSVSDLARDLHDDPAVPVIINLIFVHNGVGRREEGGRGGGEWGDGGCFMC